MSDFTIAGFDLPNFDLPNFDLNAFVANTLAEDLGEGLPGGVIQIIIYKQSR